MLLVLAMASLICALAAGVFGFEGTSSHLAELVWARILIVPLLGLTVTAFVADSFRCVRIRRAGRRFIPHEVQRMTSSEMTGIVLPRMKIRTARKTSSRS